MQELALLMRPFLFSSCPGLGLLIGLGSMVPMTPVSTMPAMTEDVHQRTGQQQKERCQADKVGTMPEYKIDGDSRDAGQQCRAFDVLKTAKHVQSPLRR